VATIAVRATAGCGGVRRYFRLVISINGNCYRLVLLDTNALSEFSKQGDSLRHFLAWSGTQPMFVPCFSLFSVLEMRRRPDVYGRFKELFRVLPCMLVKSHEQLLEDEVRCYPDPSSIDPTLLAFSMLGGEGMDLVRVLDTSDDEFFRSREKDWNDGAQDVVEGIASLTANFPPDGDTYTRDEVRLFVEMAGFSQVAMRQLDFATQTVEMENRPVTISAFPSVKATTYVVWHKFYADRNRTWTRSDAFDLIIASSIPYVDAVVTESHLAEGLRKTKRLDDFIGHLAIHTLRDFRTSAPAAPRTDESPPTLATDLAISTRGGAESLQH
jgi:hypothetical protein